MVAPHSFPTLDDAKRVVRQHALAARRHQDAAACGAAVAGHVMRACPPPPGAVVAGFLPIAEEIDLLPLLTILHQRGHRLVLPVTPSRGLPLTFRAWAPGERLITERFGTRRSDGPELAPDFLLVPLLAFDRLGRRLGYGGGYYDRTLAGLPGRFALGCAYASQEVEAVPAGPRDIVLDAVATEHGVIRCGRH